MVVLVFTSYERSYEDHHMRESSSFRPQEVFGCGQDGEQGKLFLVVGVEGVLLLFPSVPLDLRADSHVCLLCFSGFLAVFS